MTNNKIDYIELKAKDLEAIKTFYSQTFGWTFKDYGPTYVAFSDAGVEGGFEKTEDEIINGALVVLYHENLEQIKEKVSSNGGSIVQEIFEFPGGRRFHFTDPSGNELAIWSDN